MQCAVFLLVIAIVQITLTCIFLNDRNSSNALNAVESWNFKDMDAIQEQHMCCGKTSAQDYIVVNKDIPASCFADKNAAAPSGLFMEGCKSKLQTYYETETVWIAIMSWLLIAFEVNSNHIALWR